MTKTKSLLQSGILPNFRHDLPASLVVFLVALPLCLGIAPASGAPLFSGIVAGIIGGIVVGILSGSKISVSGPAANLAVIAARFFELEDSTTALSSRMGL
jgi:MFS superfamily sulfate permease-like transporter